MSETQTEQINVGQTTDPFIDDTSKLQIAHALGLESLEDIKKYQDQIARLTEWGKAKGAKDTLDLIWQIKDLANRIGGPRFGENNVRNLSTYAYLELERMKIDKQLKEYGTKETNTA